MQLNLSKQESRQLVELVLSKNNFDFNTKAKVCIILDGSGSMSNLYNNGTVQALVDRALAVGYKFDDDGAIDVFDFASEGDHRMLPQASQNDHGSYMKGKCMLNGGTSYAGVLERMCDFYYKETKSGLFGLFGKTKAAKGRDGKGDKFPVFCIFITDGASQTMSSDRRVIDSLLDKHGDLFINFVGVGNSSYFTFLEDIANKHKNSSCFSVTSLGSITDEELLDSILNSKAKDVLNG